MPKERKDTQPALQEVEDEVESSSGLVGGGEIATAADQLAAVTLADKDEAASGRNWVQVQVSR